MSETIINGIDVSESVLTATNNDVYYSQIAVDELQNNIKRLQKENEKQKKQIKDLQVRKDKYYLKNLEYEKEMSYLIQALEEIRDMVSKLIAKKGYAEDEEDFILAKTQGVLNDRN